MQIDGKEIESSQYLPHFDAWVLSRVGKSLLLLPASRVTQIFMTLDPDELLSDYDG